MKKMCRRAACNSISRQVEDVQLNIGKSTWD